MPCLCCAALCSPRYLAPHLFLRSGKLQVERRRRLAQMATRAEHIERRARQSRTAATMGADVRTAREQCAAVCASSKTGGFGLSRSEWLVAQPRAAGVSAAPAAALSPIRSRQAICRLRDLGNPVAMRDLDWLLLRQHGYLIRQCYRAEAFVVAAGLNCAPPGSGTLASAARGRHNASQTRSRATSSVDTAVPNQNAAAVAATSAAVTATLQASHIHDGHMRRTRDSRSALVDASPCHSSCLSLR